jgi:hypothetical protein
MAGIVRTVVEGTEVAADTGEVMRNLKADIIPLRKATMKVSLVTEVNQDTEVSQATVVLRPVGTRRDIRAATLRRPTTTIITITTAAEL